MIKAVQVVLFFTSMMLVCSTCLAKNCRLTPKQVNVYLDRIEKALPVLEKQAGTIAGLLQSDQGIEEIRQELHRLQGYTDLPGERTPLYGKLNLIKANDDFFLRGKEFIPFYSLEILHDLTNGGCYGTTSYDKALRDTSPEQWTRIAGIMDKLLAVLTPLNDTVIERLSREDTQVAQGWRCELAGEKQVPYASCLYSVMFNVTDSIAHANSPLRYYTNGRERARIGRIMKKADTPSVHLEMIRKYLDYLSLRRGNVDWKNPIAAIDQMTRNMEEGRDVIAEFDSKSIIPVTDLVGF